MNRNKTITLGLIQPDIAACQVEKNLATYSQTLADLKASGVQLALLPEFFPTGNTMEPALLNVAIKTSARVRQWLYDQSEQLDMIIAGSFLSFENGQVYNRFAVQEPGAELTGHLKTYIPVPELIYSKEADDPFIVETSLGKIGLIICAESFIPEIVATDFSQCVLVLVNFAIPDFLTRIVRRARKQLTQFPLQLARRNGVPVALCSVGGTSGSKGSAVMPFKWKGKCAGRSGVYLPSGPVAGPLPSGIADTVIAQIPLGPEVAPPAPHLPVMTGLPMGMRVHDRLFKSKAKKLYKTNLDRYTA